MLRAVNINREILIRERETLQFHLRRSLIVCLETLWVVLSKFHAFYYSFPKSKHCVNRQFMTFWCLSLGTTRIIMNVNWDNPMMTFSCDLCETTLCKHRWGNESKQKKRNGYFWGSDCYFNGKVLGMLIP